MVLAGAVCQALFANPWMAALDISPDQPRDGLMIGMTSSFLGDFLVALILLHIVIWSGASTWGMGAFVGFITWLGFFAATQFPQGIYEKRPVKLFAINAGYWLVGLLVIAPVLAVWR